MKGRKGGWRGEDQTQTGTQQGRLHGSDQNVQDHERGDTGHNGRNGSADDPCAARMHPNANGQTDIKRQSVNGEGEQQRAKQHNGDHSEQSGEYHSVLLDEIIVGRALHHRHSAICDLEIAEQQRSGKAVSDLPLRCRAMSSRLKAERVINSNDPVSLAVIVGTGHGAISVSGLKQGDANHECSGEAPCVALCDEK